MTGDWLTVPVDAYISSMDQYREMYDRSLKDNDGFWAEVSG